MSNSPRDFSEDLDFYTQGFEREGVASVWISAVPASGSGVDVLQELCGVGYYNLDNQESHSTSTKTDVRDLLRQISYSNSFIDAAAESASAKAVPSGFWVVVQFDFAYDPKGVSRPIAAEPQFIGVFPYSTWHSSAE